MRRTYFETSMNGHPNVSIICSNVPCFVTDAKGRLMCDRAGDPIHATIPEEEFEELHGESQNSYLTPFIEAKGEEYFRGIIAKTEQGYALLDYDVRFVIRFNRADGVSADRAMEMADEPTAEEFEGVLATQKIPRRFEAVYQKCGCTAERREADRRFLAMDRLCRSHPLHGLTEDILEEVREGRLDVYVVRESARNRQERLSRRTFEIRDLHEALTGKYPGKHIKARREDSAKLGMIFTAEGKTAEGEPDGSPRCICYYEMPTGARRGILIAFETAILKRVRFAKHHLLLNWYPTFLWDCQPRSRPEEQPPSPHEIEPAAEPSSGEGPDEAEEVVGGEEVEGVEGE